MTDRDTFAAAALTGLLANPHDDLLAKDSCYAAMAYDLADAMLRERERVTEAIPKEKRAEVSSKSHERNDEKRVLSEAHNEIAELKEAIRRLAAQNATLSVCDGNVTVTLDATLTDEEREAVRQSADAYADDDANDECAKIAATLRSLLARLA